MAGLQKLRVSCSELISGLQKLDINLTESRLCWRTAWD